MQSMNASGNEKVAFDWTFQTIKNYNLPGEGRLHREQWFHKGDYHVGPHSNHGSKCWTNMRTQVKRTQIENPDKNADAFIRLNTECD
jgi:hypothetical protein